MTNRAIPSISVVVPVHNEEGILDEQVSAMLAEFRARAYDFELILVENGSTDRTGELSRAMAAQNKEIRVVHLDIGDYGEALRAGILSGQNEVVVIFNVEFWSIEFVAIAMTALETRTLVTGSKSAPGAFDERPLLRRAITSSYNQMLRWVWSFDGTDTHGMKAFWRVPLLPITTACRTRGFVFDTEFVLRAQRAGLSKIELPTDVREVRAPSYSSLGRRVGPVLRNLWILSRSLPPQTPRPNEFVAVASKQAKGDLS